MQKNFLASAAFLKNERRGEKEKQENILSSSKTEFEKTIHNSTQQMETVLANNTVLYPSAFHPTVNKESSLFFLSARADGRLCTTKFF